jgi:hypothetical protein
MLVGMVNGTTRLTVQDSSLSALGSGYAGLWTPFAGVDFEGFSLTGVGGGGGGGDGGVSFALDVTHTDIAHVFQAVDPMGTSYATSLADPSRTLLFASTDGRNWIPRGVHAAGAFDVMTALANGALLADTFEAVGHVIARSTDRGATWQDILRLGNYRALTPHSFAELDGMVYLLEYQSFTQDSTPIRLYASLDGGATWTTRFIFNGHRLRADPSTHVLWALFGDSEAQSGIYRSTDAGRSWQLLLGGQDGIAVDATPLPGGGLLFGQDILFLPRRPSVVRLDSAGRYTILAPFIGPSYSIHALEQGGFVVGTARERIGDIYPPAEVSAHLYGSADGVTWTRLLDYPWLDPNDYYVRADVYWELPTHELVLTLYNAAGFGPGGRGYQLLRRR